MKNPFHLFRILFFFLFILTNSSAYSSNFDGDAALPSIPVKLYSGKGSHNADYVNFRSSYRNASWLGVLYVPQSSSDKVDWLETFYTNFTDRDKFISPAEQVSASCQCLFLTAEPEEDLQDTIARLKPFGGFYVAADNGALLRRYGLDAKKAWLLLFRSGRLLWKEIVTKADEIAHF